MSTVRKAFKKVFDLASGGYSLSKVPDLEGAERYVCKGTGPEAQPTIVINTPAVDTAKRHDEYWKIYQSVKDTKSEKYNKMKKNKEHKEDFIKHVITEFQDGRWKDGSEYFVTTQEIVGAYQRWTKSEDVKPMGRTTLDSIVLYLVNLLDNDHPGYQAEAFKKYYMTERM